MRSSSEFYSGRNYFQETEKGNGKISGRRESTSLEQLSTEMADLLLSPDLKMKQTTTDLELNSCSRRKRNI
jgi:hypothetical protein